MRKIFFTLLSIALYAGLSLIIFSCGNDNGKQEASAEENEIESPKEPFEKFFFTGMADGNAAIFKYVMEDKKHELFWSSKKEQVVELSFSEDRKNAFFITASGYGKTGVFPFINNVKVYQLKPEEDSTVFLKNAGSGLQVFSKWEDENSFKVVLNNIDKTVAKYIEQHTHVFNIFGKQLLEETKRYDLDKEGYPAPVKDERSRTVFKDKYKAEANDSALYLIDLKSNERKFVAAINFDLNKVEWSKDGNYFFFSTLDVSPSNETLYDRDPSTSRLYIYSLKEDKIVKEFNGGGLKNFFIKNNLLIFDDGFSEKSKIIIFDYKELKAIDTIEIKGGCGLRGIPERPDYSA